MRDQIRAEIELIQPMDDLERSHLANTLQWVDSGVELCRLVKPDTPAKHLISYFLLVDGDYVLLVDHINAELWLPTGGHVEPNEHPRTTVSREVKEELAVEVNFLVDAPIFLTETYTVGKSAGHTDVSLWYVLAGDREQVLTYDHSEFLSVRWFHRKEIPMDRTDPHIDRFLRKFY